MTMEYCPGISPEASWEPLCRELAAGEAVFFLLGSTDTGKSSLAEYLVRSAVSGNMEIALLDTDVGQSRLGLPGTIGLKIYREAGDIGSDEPDGICFVGTLNPADEITLMTAGVRTMAEKAKELGVRRMVVDTTGHVSGEAAKALKLGKIKVLHPSMIVAIQQGEELQHILTELDSYKVTRLSPSPLVSARSREARARYRQARFSEYFSRPWLLQVPQNRVQVLFRGKPIVLGNNRIRPGCLAGLNRQEETRALGIIDECSGDSLKIMTPLSSLEGIDRILVSDISVPELW